MEEEIYYAVNLVRSANSVSADIFEVLPDCLEIFKRAEGTGKSFSPDGKSVAMVKIFKKYEDARKFYDKYTESMYKF